MVKLGLKCIVIEVRVVMKYKGLCPPSISKNQE
jgi:hypothetical protein